MKFGRKTAVISIVLVGFLVALVVAGTHKHAGRAWLGVYTQSVDYDLAEAFELPVNYGAIINEVIDDSPADEAGMRDGDVVIGIDGERVTDDDDLVDIIREHQVGDEVEIVIMRDEREMTLLATLGKRPKGGKLFGGSFWDEDDEMTFHFLDTHDRVYIGVSLMDLTDQLGEYFGTEGDQGALVTEVERRSPAEKAGIKAGDVIVEADGDEVSDGMDVAEALEDFEEGDTVTLTVLRDGQRVHIDVEVEEGEGTDFYGGYNFFSLPDIPRIDIQVPKVPRAPKAPKVPDVNGYIFHQLDDLRDLYDQEDIDELQDQMRELRRELKRMKEELKELDRLRKLPGDDG
jgi:serine protease Do